jgi:hypothetical protein
MGVWRNMNCADMTDEISLARKVADTPTSLPFALERRWPVNQFVGSCCRMVVVLIKDGVLAGKSVNGEWIAGQPGVWLSNASISASGHSVAWIPLASVGHLQTCVSA